MQKVHSIKEAALHQTLCINYVYAFRARTSRCNVPLKNLLCFVFLNSDCGKHSKHNWHFKRLKAMGNCSAGENLGLKCTVPWSACIQRATIQPKTQQCYLQFRRAQLKNNEGKKCSPVSNNCKFAPKAKCFYLTQRGMTKASGHL